ncbi:MAG: hypothetical protein ABIQ31_16670 [Ferruginibacter sp.]
MKEKQGENTLEIGYITFRAANLSEEFFLKRLAGLTSKLLIYERE